MPQSSAGPVSLALEARLRHSCSALRMVLFLSASVLGRKEFSTCLPVIADLCFVSVQEPGSRTVLSLFQGRGLLILSQEWGFFPGSWGIGGFPILPQKQIPFTSSLSQKQKIFSWAQVWEALLLPPPLGGLRICFISDMDPVNWVVIRHVPLVATNYSLNTSATQGLCASFSPVPSLTQEHLWRPVGKNVC